MIGAISFSKYIREINDTLIIGPPLYNEQTICPYYFVIITTALPSKMDFLW